MKIRKRWLLAIAAIVWFAAGFNILRIGLQEYQGFVSLINILLSIIVFLSFYFFIFSRLVVKHTVRIKGYLQEKQYFWNFFDIPSFIIMAFMMSGGIWLRSSGFAAPIFIAVFYSRLGTALILAGILFGVNFIRWEV